VLESLEAGVPCVAVPVPSLKEIFEADAPYLLAKNSTAQALADAVLKTLEQSKISVKKDIEKVLSYYQYDKFINDWVNFLKNTIQPC
jgi:glycosyltransferase involved in cell wall biosynthesis